MDAGHRRHIARAQPPARPRSRPAGRQGSGAVTPRQVAPLLLPARGGQSGACDRAPLRQSLHAAGRGDPVGPGDRRGVNKATTRLFKVADTPETMLALGEAGLNEYIRTIGLYNNKAKAIIAMSRALLDQHGGQVPAEREALERAARGRPQDRERGAQRRLRPADDRGRHPRLPGRQPHRPRTGQDAARGRAARSRRACREATPATPITG